jgi:hypothetical protein
MGLFYLLHLTLRTLGFPQDIFLMGLLCILVQTLRLCTGRKAHGGSRGLALLFLDHGIRRGWEVSVTLRWVYWTNGIYIFSPCMLLVSSIAQFLIRWWTSGALRQTNYWLWDVFCVFDSSIGFDANIFLCKVLSKKLHCLWKRHTWRIMWLKMRPFWFSFGRWTHESRLINRLSFRSFSRFLSVLSGHNCNTLHYSTTVNFHIFSSWCLPSWDNSRFYHLKFQHAAIKDE